MSCVSMRCIHQNMIWSTNVKVIWMYNMSLCDISDKWNGDMWNIDVKWNGKVIIKYWCDMSYVIYELYEYDVGVDLNNVWTMICRHDVLPFKSYILNWMFWCCLMVDKET